MTRIYNSSGILGVHSSSTIKNGKRYSYWRAVIRQGGRVVSLGQFPTPGMAKRARDNALKTNVL